ncbi:MAG: energy transducer TonB [Gammaproteobacteria bacterium]
MTVTFKDAVRAAVKGASRYPRAAQAMGVQGRTEVAFRYKDGKAQDVRVVRPSGSAILDQAAVDAVRNASLPSPPHALRGHTLRFRVWLRFHFHGAG